MKRVLVLSYYFPPHGGAGVQRTVKFLKHLAAFGYEAVVVTGPETTSLDWAPRDDTLAADLAATNVVRIPGPEPTWSSGWRSRAERWLTLEEGFTRWWVDGATALGQELAPEADVVYASMSPFETGVAAERIATAAGKPWVVDLRDPWALDDWTVFPTALHRRNEERRMRRVLSRADAVVLNSPEATRAVLNRFPELRSVRTATIPNGWDREDFQRPAATRTDSAFRVVYVGYAHVEAGRRHSRGRSLLGSLGGAVPGLDVLARSHLYLLDAVDELVAEDPALADRLEVHLAGAHDVDDRTGAHPLVRFHGYLPHPEAIDLMRSADLLFLPMQDLAPGVRTRTVPGKTYEYLAARRPILGALPDGDARDLLAALPCMYLCRPRESSCIANGIRRSMGKEASREPLALPDALLTRYERRELTRRLAEVFDAAVQDRALAEAV